ncbi:hypothetical protein [uncultured Azohydromonas sp.]|jgi:hypothetical protein|uniref:hypothetical protein n=1 Tax=uncultured Azohydromonas sp. TaxID=487342 RepID=UPI00262DB0E5|nr:hypothetical protein [uncultured Azohydromonas sp.]
MSPLLSSALSEAQLFIAERGWRAPTPPTLHEAQRLIELTAAAWPAPEVTVEPDGAIALAWESAERGWLKFSVRGQGELAHEAVIEGDDYEQVEAWLADAPGATLPDWAHELLHRLWPCDA